MDHEKKRSVSIELLLSCQSSNSNNHSSCSGCFRAFLVDININLMNTINVQWCITNATQISS